MDHIDAGEAVDRFLRNNDVAGAASHLEALLRTQPSDHFTSLVEKRFTNSPRSILEHLNAFIDTCEKHFDVAAVYLEMSVDWSFHFDSFAYTEYTDDPDDLDWLSRAVFIAASSFRGLLRRLS